MKKCFDVINSCFSNVWKKRGFKSDFLRVAVFAVCCFPDGLLFAESYTNPVIKSGADPYCRRISDGTYCLLTTGLNFFQSDDLVHWTSKGRLKIEGGWGEYDAWAPEFIENDGRFYLFYCARKEPKGKHYLGVAVSDRPEGPYSAKPEPLTEIAPSIDQHVFTDDDGTRYLYWSEKGIGVEHRAINGCELREDLMGLKGEPRMLIFSEQDWEYAKAWKNKGWNEGPFILKRDGLYYLMYSANLYASPYYGLGYAVSKNPLGPFEKWEGNPVLSREGFEELISGPGHHSVVESPDGKELFAVYHKHLEPGETKRHVCIDRMGFRSDGTLYVNGPTITPQPMPSGVGGRKNLAKTAQITATSGRRKELESLNDGEISICARLAGQEWQARSFGENPVIKLQWDAPRRISEVYVYAGADQEQVPAAVRIYLPDGAEFNSNDYLEGPGAAFQIVFPEQTAEWLTVELQPAEGCKSLAVSEIMVWGRSTSVAGPEKN